MDRRNVRRIQWIADDNARQAALRRRRTQLVQTAEELSAVCDADDVTVAAPEATAILMQRYAATDPSSVNTLDLEEFLGRRIAELKTELTRREAANAEAEAKLVVYDVIQGHKDVGDVPIELLADIKKVVEKSIQEIAGAIVYLRSL